MRRTHLLPFALCAALFQISCGPDDKDCGGTDPGFREDFNVRLWVYEHRDLPKADIERGCDLWMPKGVACRMVDHSDAANLRVHVDDGPCDKNPQGGVTLAWAVQGGDITFKVKCLSRDLLGNLDLRQLRTVMGHEAGHEFGIWEHIPDVCDANAKVHPNGEKICGDAMMNANYDPAVSTIAHPDDLAFDVRSKDASVLKEPNGSQPLTDASQAPTCVFDLLNGFVLIR